jgi:hypothetical protein
MSLRTSERRWCGLGRTCTAARSCTSRWRSLPRTWLTVSPACSGSAWVRWAWARMQFFFSNNQKIPPVSRTVRLAAWIDHHAPYGQFKGHIVRQPLMSGVKEAVE